MCVSFVEYTFYEFSCTTCFSFIYILYKKIEWSHMAQIKRSLDITDGNPQLLLPPEWVDSRQ